MSIIEKLGITTGPWKKIEDGDNFIQGVFEGRDGYNGWYSGPCESDLSLIAAAPEMLEALIRNTEYMFSWSEEAMEDGIYFSRHLYNENTSIIEKATGKSWEEIKGLIE